VAETSKRDVRRSTRREMIARLSFNTAGELGFYSCSPALR
jgi:hypothetical protein